MNKTGFTLMEMLVVVTIIGILASIAIPQYQQAVLKSRYVKMMPLVKSLKQAEEEYYLMHREYAYDFNELGFRFNGALGSSTSGSAEGRDRSAAMRGEGFVLRINENGGLPTIDAALLDGTNTLTAYLIYLTSRGCTSSVKRSILLFNNTAPSPRSDSEIKNLRPGLSEYSVVG